MNAEVISIIVSSVLVLSFFMIYPFLDLIKKSGEKSVILPRTPKKKNYKKSTPRLIPKV
tara:strand:- start:341 stop:517 length:177 start_codon:yes stop_codon:yes gene_type:complete